MSIDVAAKISNRVKLLPTSKQELVLEFVENISESTRSFMDIVREIEDTIPIDVLNSLPIDGAKNHDHYLYGAPKK
ncbi:hypothetical protein BH10ACI2_BH10ACI2_26150 [soil metagenome]